MLMIHITLGGARAMVNTTPPMTAVVAMLKRRRRPSVTLSPFFVLWCR